MASRLDRFGLLDIASQTLRTGTKVAEWSERRVIGLLRSGLDALDPPVPPYVAATADESSDGLASRLRRLLDRSLDEGPVSGRQELFHKLLDQMVPDEARIIEALSDGSASALVHVYAQTQSGLVDEVVLENMSLVGRAANLALPHLTPTYVSHLRSLGLLETGPEDPSLETDYQSLTADTAVLRALKQAGRGPVPPRVDRGTLRLSGLGLELWAAANRPGA